MIFLLSPARCTGRRADLLLRPTARFELAMQLRTPMGASIAEVFSFLSGLYFRGKLAYAKHFAKSSYVITATDGLLDINTMITLDDLSAMRAGSIDAENAKYRQPIERDLDRLAKSHRGEFVLLGSIATKKYVDVLLPHLRERLHFPAEFVGRGDMSRGGLLLRCVRENRPLTYVPVDGAIRHGTRPPKLAPVAMMSVACTRKLQRRISG